MSDWLYNKISWFAGCVAIAFLFGLVALISNLEIKDVDLWLHLAVGKHIVQTFSIPQVDFLSNSIANTPWINHEWLFQSIVYFFYSNVGIEGLIALKMWVVFLTFALLLYLGYTREQKFGPIVMLLLVLLVYQLRMTLRPDMFSLFFFVLYIVVLGVYLHRRWSIVAILILQIIWTNMHGFFIFGPVIALVALASECIKRRIHLPYEWNKIGRLSDHEYGQLKLITVISVLACLVNPYFIEGAWYPISILFSLGGESKVFFKEIQELQKPIHWGNIFIWQSYFHYKLLIVISFLSFFLNRRKIDLNAFFLWLIFLIFSLCALRNIVYFAFAAYFAFLTNTQGLSIEKYFPKRYRNIKFKSIGSIILKVMLIVWMMNYTGQLMLRGYYDFDHYERKSEYGGSSLHNYAYKAANFLVENNIRGNFYNDFNSGAYLLGRTSPNIKVFIDGRTEVYGTEFYNKQRKIWEGDTQLFEEAVHQYRLTGAFLNYVYVPAPAQTIKHLYDSKEWVLVYFDYDASIFLKNIPSNQSWINQYRIDLNHWVAPDAELLKIGVHKVSPSRQINRAYALYNMGFPQKAQEEIIQALRIQPYNDKAYKLLGKILNEQKKYAEAFESLRIAKLLSPDDIRVRYQIAFALFHLGEIEQSMEQCLLVLENSPNYEEALMLLAQILITEKEYSQGINVLKQIQSNGGHEAKGFIEISKMLLEQKEYAKANEVLRLALDIEPGNQEIQQKLNMNF